MGTYNSAVITNGGQSMIAQAVAGASLEFTTIKTSSYAYPAGTNLATLTTINGITQSKDITGAAVYNSRVIKISAAVDNTGISTAYAINTIGIYAKVGSAAEALFAVVTASSADTMPAYDNKPYSYIYNINLTMQNAANVTVMVNAAGLVNVADLNAAKVEIQGEIADLKSQLDDIASRFVTGKNLLDPDKVSTGIIISAADGRTEQNASYNTSDFIPISIGQSITISPNCRKFLAYSSAKVAIQSTYIDAGVNTAYTYAATENGFIRITYLATNGQEQVEYGSVASSYEPYQLSIANDIDLSDDQKYYINNAIDAVLVPVESDVDHICQKTVGDNIYDPSTPLTTGWLTSSGIVDATGTGANFATTDFIPIEEDTDYVVANVQITQSANIGSRILIALYDSAHNYIANTFQNVANVTPMQVTFNSGNAAFLRVSTLPAHMGSNPTSEWRLYIGEGTTSPSVYIPYSVVYYNRMIIQPGYGALTEEDLSGIRETVKSKNIYDASKPLTTGWIEGVHGTVDATGTGANFATTDFIPVEQNTAYIIANERMNIAGSVIGSRILMALYDANKNYIANTFQNVVNVNPMQVTFNSGDAVYLRVSTLPMHLGEHPTSDFALIVQKGSVLDGYTTYWTKDVSILNPSQVSAADNVLFGKKYVACGDSLTAGDFTGYTDQSGYTDIHSDAFSPEYGTYKTYPYWIAKRNNMQLINAGINGSTMAISKEYINGTESSIEYRSPFSYQRYKDIPADADYITIWFGVNDSNHTYLGTIDDADNTTFYGAWNVVLPYLVEHHPNAKIGIVITFGIPDSPYTVAVRQIAKKWGIPFFDFAQGEQSPIIIRNKDTGYAVDSDMVDMRLSQFRVAVDNNHPNVQAHKFESTCLEAWMRSL